MNWPNITLIGAGAAGLWCALRLVERGCPGTSITLIEPDAKDSDDRTWSYWTHQDLLPAELIAAQFHKIEIASGGARSTFDTRPYRYESLRSSAFYAYAKTRLATAEVTWVCGTVDDVKPHHDGVTVAGQTCQGDDFALWAEYVLDSRLPNLSVPTPGGTTEASIQLLQPFAGWYVETDIACFDPEVMTFMDFVPSDGEVCFFYVIPQRDNFALVEIALFGSQTWTQARFDAALDHYLQQRYGLSAGLDSGGAHTAGFGESRQDTTPTGRNASSSNRSRDPLPQNPTQHPVPPEAAMGHYRILEREYGTIPMTDRPLWRDSSARIWKIGTAAGWVQPSSGYAFTRIARFADEVAASLQSPAPLPWTPKPVQQIYQSVMLGHLRDYPERTGDTFLRLFRGAGAATAFAFLDERATAWQTLRVMNASPKLAFIQRTAREVWARVRKRK